jgi:hypothetical protein
MKGVICRLFDGRYTLQLSKATFTGPDSYRFLLLRRLSTGVVVAVAELLEELLEELLVEEVEEEEEEDIKAMAELMERVVLLRRRPAFDDAGEGFGVLRPLRPRDCVVLEFFMSDAEGPPPNNHDHIL